MTKCLHFLLALVVFSPTTWADEKKGLESTPRPPLSGTLLERGTRRPLADVNVYLLTPGTKPIKATTDENGHFQLTPNPQEKLTGDQRAHFVVNLTGYRRLDQELSEESQQQLFLQKISYREEEDLARSQDYETKIYGKIEKRDPGTKSLQANQLSQAGSGNDPVKAIQNLPGVGQINPLSGLVVIQGSAPQDTGYTIDGMIIPIAFHFGGFTSILTPETIERVDYLPAGYGPEYGQAMGGFIGIWTRGPRNDRWQGFGFGDTFNAGALVEGPLGKDGGALLAFRKSYIGAVLGAVTKGNSSFDLTTAPDYSDLVLLFDKQVTPIDHLKILTVGSLDELGFLFNEPSRGDPSIRGGLSNQTAFFRIIPQITHRHSWKTTSRLNLSFGRDWLKVENPTLFYRSMTYAFQVRFEIERQMTDGWKSILGLDSQNEWPTVNYQIPRITGVGGVRNPFSTSGYLTQATSTYSTELQGLYWRNSFNLLGDDLNLSPSLRLEYYNFTRELLPQPRLGVTYRVSNPLKLHAMSGLYRQAPQDQQLDSGSGNPNLASQAAYHLALGSQLDFKQDRSQGWSVTSDFFYKYFDQLVIPSPAVVKLNGQNGASIPVNYTNEGSGRAYGFELMARFELSAFTGWIAYTLSRSTRINPSLSETIFQYDQTHVLTAVAGYELGSNLKMSGRFRYITGNPYTPTLGGTFDADSDAYLPTRGPIYSSRLGPVLQLDVRIEKKWIYDRWILSAYLDLLNATNTMSPLGVTYSYDYKQVAFTSGLPIIPVFGVKGEF